MSERAKLLIVDDDADVRKTLRLLFEDQYEVVTAKNKPTCLSALTQDINAIILDIKLPKTDGFQICKEIKSRYPHIPVIFYSAYSDLKNPYDVLNELHPFAFITKGDRHQNLVEEVQKAVEQNQTGLMLMTMAQTISDQMDYNAFIHQLCLVYRKAISPTKAYLVYGDQKQGYTVLAKFTPDKIQVFVKPKSASNYRDIPKRMIKEAESTLKLSKQTRQGVNRAVIPLVGANTFVAGLFVESEPNDVYFFERLDWISPFTHHAANAIYKARRYHVTKSKLDRIQGRNSTLEAQVANQLKDLDAAKAQLENAKEEAERANHFKSQFLANISHDLRTPLHVIIGTNDELLKNKKIKGDKKINRQIEMIYKSSERLLSLVNDILDVTKLESGKMDINIQTFDLSELLVGIPDMMKILIGDKKVKFKIENELGKSHHISSDMLRLNQVMTNLLSNSAKFTESGQITLRVFEEQGRLNFEISDTGIGLKEEDQAVIFDSFTQVDTDVGRRQSGTGLGLTISKGIIERLGGKIWVESKYGKGSTFSFYIPDMLTEEPISSKETKPQHSDKELEALRSRRVLLCDDDEFNRAFADMILGEYLNYTLVDSGRSAIEKIKEEPYDLVLMDVQMPEMDGRQALKHIKKLKPDLPVVALTAQAMKGDREELLKQGFTDYLSKPFKSEDLISFLMSRLK